MSIPKVLHYCWFGGAPKPKNIQNCIRSWKKYCPDYAIIEWNEQNFDVSQSLYTRQAYDARRWAFVADYARLKILYEQGGIYMDTDVELLRPLDDLGVSGLLRLPAQQRGRHWPWLRGRGPQPGGESPAG